MNTTTDDRSIFALTDKEALDRILPQWARSLNSVYRTVFAPLNRFVDYLSSITTRRLITRFERDNN